MKIVIISNLYPPFMRGGGEITAAKLAEGLKENLNHVAVISAQPYSGFGSLKPSLSEVNGVKVYRFYPLNIYFYMNDYQHAFALRLGWHLLDIFNLSSYFVVRRLLQKEKPDLVITHNLMGIGFLIPLLIRRLKIRHYHTIHDVQLYTPSGLIIKGKENGWTQRIGNILGYPGLMKVLMGSPEVIISPSDWLINFYREKKYFPQSHFVRLRNIPDRPNDLVTYSEDESLRLIYVGQISRAKGVAQLVTLIREMTGVNLTLRVIGLGPDLPRTLDLARGDDRIQFFGWRKRYEVMELLSQSDAMIVPSMCYENSPTVIMESLVQGLPVVTADIGGAGELIQDGYNGWKFPAGNWEQLKNILFGLIENKNSLSGMRANCRQSVKDLTTNNYIEQLMALVNDKNHGS